ncbi:LuxR family transcriptional regulator [Solimonas sp. K1W22B-7]|uniref:response regulator transcription factor n=1 Tax=Solimonas sp. K1W22B-7 TaxID=2303331 RepID=UPI000E334F17|nr:helix-turn-helix transcriptional regulator [Solimonas sp. K1W22B-7]AXQ30023.1 LuxR family transcriptional regulator [Solimonas sp. K1W22B-7]
MMQVHQSYPAPTPNGRYQSLTGREIDALELAGTGLSMKSIAQELGISCSTVRWHLKNAYQKLGAVSREDALKKARARQLIGAVIVCQVCACRLSRTLAAHL